MRVNICVVSSEYVCHALCACVCMCACVVQRPDLHPKQSSFGIYPPKIVTLAVKLVSFLSKLRLRREISPKSEKNIKNTKQKTQNERTSERA